MLLLAGGFGLSLIQAGEANHCAQTAAEIRASLRRAIDAIEKNYGSEYSGEDYMARLEALPDGDLDGLRALQREALLANPTLYFEDVLLIRRQFGDKARKVYSQAVDVRHGNFNSIARSQRSGWNTSISLLRGAGQTRAGAMFFWSV